MKRAVTIMLCSLLAASCGRGGSDAGAGDAGPFETMLAVIPDTEDYRESVEITDFDRAIEASGLEQPAPEDTEATIEFYRTLFAGSDPPIMVNSSGFGDRPLEIESWREQFGFSVIDVDRSVQAGVPPSKLVAVQGSFDSGSIEDALSTDPVWSADLTEMDHEGQAFFQWSDPMRPGGPPSAARPLGRGGALAIVGDDTVLRSPDPAAVTDALDAATGSKGSLAGSPTFVAVAQALDTNGAYSAFLTNRGTVLSAIDVIDLLDPDPPSPEEVEAKLEAIPTLPAYLVLGLGQGLSETGEPLLIVSFAMPDPESAKMMLDAFAVVVEEGTSREREVPWSTMLTIKESEVDGDVATIVMETENQRLGRSAYFTRDSLFVMSG